MTDHSKQSDDARLTNEDILILEYLAEKGDRHGFWSYLKGKGDNGYAELGLGVTTNETLLGSIANSYAAARARQLGRVMTDEQWWQLGVDIMRRDIAIRRQLFNAGAKDGGLNPPIRMIADYHIKAMEKNGLDAYAWTAYPLLKAELENGQDDLAEKTWSMIQRGDFSDNAQIAFGMHGLAMGEAGLPSSTAYDAANWLGAVMGGLINYQGQNGSYRNLNQIDGWTREPKSGAWGRFNPDSMNDGLAPLRWQEAPPETVRQLNSTRQLREERFRPRQLEYRSGGQGESVKQTNGFPTGSPFEGIDPAILFGGRDNIPSSQRFGGRVFADNKALKQQESPFYPLDEEPDTLSGERFVLPLWPNRR